MTAMATTSAPPPQRCRFFSISSAYLSFSKYTLYSFIFLSWAPEHIEFKCKCVFESPAAPAANANDVARFEFLVFSLSTIVVLFFISLFTCSDRRSDVNTFKGYSYRNGRLRWPTEKWPQRRRQNDVVYAGIIAHRQHVYELVAESRVARRFMGESVCVRRASASYKR